MNERLRSLLTGRPNPEKPPVLTNQFTPEIGTRSLRIREWELPSSVEANLTRSERELLDLGIRAGRSIARLYNAQEGKGIRANFYPQGVKRDVVRRAAINDPEILSHYTVVTRRPDGGLAWVPMHQAYSQVIHKEKIPETLRAAADVARRAEDPYTFRYLRATADSFTTGDYKTRDRLWLTRPDESKIEIVAGPYDNYTDKFLGIKYAAQAWIGVRDEEGSRDAKQFQNEFIKTWEANTGKKAPRNKFLLLHTKGMYGQAAKYDWTGNSLPCQIEWRQEMGTINTIFVPAFEDKFTNRRLPVYRSAIAPGKRVAVSDNLVRRTNLRMYIGHEISHSFVPSGIEARLGVYALPTKELYCDLNALKTYADIPLEGQAISDREKLIALGVTFANGVLEYIDYNRDRSRPEYYVSSSTILKYCQENGSVQTSNGRINWDNQRAFQDIDSLLTIVRRVLEEGSEKEAKAFFGRLFDGDIYKPIANNMREELPFNIPRINHSPIAGQTS